MLAMKLISEEYLTSNKKQEKKRRQNLKEEIRCLRVADAETSIAMLEKFSYENCTVIITDLILGTDLDDLYKNCRKFLDEEEARNILANLIKGVARLRDKER